MLLSDIFDTACAYISEDSTTANARELENRAVLLLRAVISELASLQKTTDGAAALPPPFSGLDGAFPLDEPLGWLCSIKLAYLLCADENPTLSDRLRSEYETARGRYISSLEADISQIKDVYS